MNQRAVRQANAAAHEAEAVTAAGLAADAAEAVQTAVTIAQAEVYPSTDIQIQIDPQLLAQATMTKNARLIATLVHENAMLEVALEQERRNSGEWMAKHDALRAAFEG